MKCEKCDKQLELGTLLTPRGNEIEYAECSCGYFFVEEQSYNEDEEVLE